MIGEKSFSERVWNQLPWGTDSETEADDPVRDPDEQELEKIAQVTLMVGPDYARDLGQPQEGDMFVSPETVYRFENGRWEDLDVDTTWLINHLKAYALPARDSLP